MKLLLCDCDGVWTNAKKMFNSNGDCIGKEFCDSDRTYTRKLKEKDWYIHILTSDSWNAGYFQKNNIDYSITEEDKSPFYKICRDKYKVKSSDIYFIGDSYFDISLFIMINEENRFCPISAEKRVKGLVPPQNWLKAGGTGIMEDFYYRMYNI